MSTPRPDTGVGQNGTTSYATLETPNSFTFTPRTGMCLPASHLCRRVLRVRPTRPTLYALVIFTPRMARGKEVVDRSEEAWSLDGVPCTVRPWVNTSSDTTYQTLRTVRHGFTGDARPEGTRRNTLQTRNNGQASTLKPSTVCSLLSRSAFLSRNRPDAAQCPGSRECCRTCHDPRLSGLETLP